MAPKKFPQFEKLPLEIKRRIWVLSVAPRIIRAKNQMLITSSRHECHYFLHAGPVPRLLHVSHSSRMEGLRIFTPIGSRIFFGPLGSNQKPIGHNSTRVIYADLLRDTFFFATLHSSIGFLNWLETMGNEKMGGAGNGEVGGRSLTSSGLDGDKPVKKKKRCLPVQKENATPTPSPNTSFSTSSSSLNTSFSTQAPAIPDLSLLSRQSAPLLAKPKPGLCNLAFPLQIILKMHHESRLDSFLLAIAMLQPHIATIGIVLNANKATYASTQSPVKFYLRPVSAIETPKPKPKSTPTPNTNTKQPKLKKDGTPAAIPVRNPRGNRITIKITDTIEQKWYKDDILQLFDGFWTKSRVVVGLGVGGGSMLGYNKLTELEKRLRAWEEWVRSPRGREWSGATFGLVEFGKACGEVL